MKFYFCEKCGKRMTEIDIEQGIARDKKLGGVYCTGCAEGILTIETVPLTADLARRILKTQNNERIANASPPKNAPPRQRPVGAKRASIAREDRKYSGKIVLFAFVFVATMGVVLLVILFSWFQRKPDRQVGGKPGPIPAGSIPASHGSVPGTASGRPDFSPPLVSIKRAEMQSNISPAKDETAAESPAPRGQDAPGNFEPGRGPERAIPLEQPLPGKDPVRQSAAAAKGPLAGDSAKPLEPEWPDFDQHMDELLLAVSGEDWQTASKVFQGLPGERGTGKLPAALGQLPEALLFLESRSKIRLRALASLVGRTVAFDALDGKVVAFQEGVFQIEKSFFINGQPMGASIKKVAARELAPSLLDRLAPQPAPSGPLEHAALALQHLAWDRFQEAEPALSAAGANPLNELLRRTLKRRQEFAMEKRAKEQWQALNERLGQAQKPTQSTALAGLAELDALEAAYAQSVFAKTTGPERRLFRSALEKIAYPFEHLVRGLFKGEVRVEDAGQERITVSCDLQSKEELTGWLVDSNATLSQDEGRLRITQKGNSPLLSSGAFEVRDLILELEYDRLSYSGRNRLEIFLGIPPSAKKNDQTIRVSLGEGNAVVAKVDFSGGQEAERYFKGKLGGAVRGIVRVETRPDRIAVFFNSKQALDCKPDAWPQPSGFGIGCTSSFFPIRLRVTGRLDPAWLRQAIRARSQQAGEPSSRTKP